MNTETYLKNTLKVWFDGSGGSLIIDVDVPHDVGGERSHYSDVGRRVSMVVPKRVTKPCR